MGDFLSEFSIEDVSCARDFAHIKIFRTFAA